MRWRGSSIYRGVRRVRIGSATLLRPRTGALRPNLVFTPKRIFRQALSRTYADKNQFNHGWTRMDTDREGLNENG